MKAFCVADLFSLPLLQKSRLCCGRGGLSNKISGVNIIEAPDVADWIQGGEVLITNLYSMEQFRPLRAFTEKLKAKNLAALIVKTGLFVDVIPEEMIEAANACDLPIIEIDREILYRDIAFAITEKLLDDRIATLKYFKESHTCFVHLSLNSADAQQIVDALAGFIDNPVIVYDKDFIPLCASHAELMQAKPVEKFFAEQPYFIRPCVVDTQEPRAFEQIVFPINIVGHITINLAVCQINHEVLGIHHVAIENAVNALMIEFIKQRAVSEVEKRFHSDLLSELLSGRPFSLGVVLEQASLLQWDLKKSHAVVSFSLHNPEFADGQNGIEAQRMNYDNLYALLLTRFPRSPIQVRTDKLILLWGLDPAAGKNWVSDIKAQLEKLCRAWEKKHAKTTLRIGIGDVATEPTALARSLREAEDALAVMSQLPLAGAINAYPELGVYRLLLQFGERRQLEDFVPQQLVTLMKTRQNARNDLMRTLSVYLQCDRNMSQAAEQLHVHHKTVAYRIEQIKKITGLTLAKVDEILHLQLGLKILTVLQADPLSLRDRFSTR